MWIKAGDPLSSEGSLIGRWNKAGVPCAKKGTPSERGNKGGVLSSEEDSLLVQQDGFTKEHISCKDNVAYVNSESVLIHDLLEDLRDTSQWKCTTGRFYISIKLFSLWSSATALRKTFNLTFVLLKHWWKIELVSWNFAHSTFIIFTYFLIYK